MSDPLTEQVAGEHYLGMKIQVVEFCHANNIPYIEGAIIKHTCRHKLKNGKEDLLKARHYIDILLKLEYGEVTP